MQLVRSGIAVAAGFAVFSILFAVLGPNLGAILTTLGAGLMAGYLAAKIAGSREVIHGVATAALVALSLVIQPVLTLPARILVAVMAAATIAAGSWVRANAAPNSVDHVRRSPQGEGGKGHS